MLVFAEHRGYGETLPFGADSFTPKSLQFITTEQALADYALLIPLIKEQFDAPQATVIAFGGSYGGMLTAWMRIKYPHLIAGAISASAPLLMYPRLNNGTTYANIASRTFATAGYACYAGIADSWSTLSAWGGDPALRQQMSNVFQLCNPVNSTADVENIIFPWLANAMLTLPMGDYPYPTSFLGPLPGNPVDYVCESWTNEMSPDQEVGALGALIQVFYNYTGAAGQWSVQQAS